MKYSELIDFEPLTSVIKIADESKKTLIGNVQTYVFSDKITQLLASAVVPNLDTSGQVYEQKGISVVGSFGSGKSHLMSVISAVAEDADMLQYISNEKVKQEFESFAGKYKVLRFEVGTNKPLYELVCYRLEKFLKELGVDFHFSKDSLNTYKEQLQQMMAAFEEKYPDKYLLIVIDELLEYLRSRNAMEVNGDLMTLRQMGEMCDGSRFKVIYGVQEFLYRDPLLAHAADTLNKVQARFDDVLISKEDIAYVVKNRLLKKTSSQKQMIREHLNKFSSLFDGLVTNLNEYVDLFPVHPSYISEFQQIKHGKDKREILKDLTNCFGSLKDKDVPEDNPGLITYDSYFDKIKEDSSLLSIPDIATIKDKVELIDEKIDNYFIEGRKGKKILAKRIVNALAVHALCDDLDKHSGASAETLKEDLCFTMAGIDDADLLKDTVDSTANLLVSATQGQYIVKDEQSEDYYIRSEGGVNVDQIVKDYAESVIKRDAANADQYFYGLLKFILSIEVNPYRTGFNIWSHSIEWKSTKSFRLGYIFFGNPNERSTTEPIQEFYMYFCPLFSKMDRSDLDDEVYFDFSNFSDDFKNEVCLYAASMAKHNESSSDKKKLFEALIDEHQKKVKDIFNRTFVDKMNVIYKGKSLPLRSFQLPPEGGSKLVLFSDITAGILNDKFNKKFPDYPQFKELLTPNTIENLTPRTSSALKKIINFNSPNRDGQAILEGLGLLGATSIDIQNSKYAASVKRMLADKGPGKVLNRDDILYNHYIPLNQYYSKDYKLEYQLEFVVLAALVFSGDIEICWNGDITLTASNISDKLLTLEDDKFYTFNTIKTPSELPIKSLKKLFLCLNIADLSGSLKDSHTYTLLSQSITKISDEVAKTINALQSGIHCETVSLIDENTKTDNVNKLQNLLSLLDVVRNLDTYGKLRGFKYSEEEIQQAFNAYPICKEVSELILKANQFQNLIRYLNQAKSYVVESEKPLYDDIDNAIKELAEKLNSDTNSQKQYIAKLISLKDSYAEYYLDQYTKNRLSYDDNRKRDAIFNSDKRQICEVIKDISILNKTNYENWRNTITSLKPVESDVTKESIKENPYKDFSPRENYDKPKYTVRKLGEQLDEIYDGWIKAMKSTFNDPESKQGLAMLSDEQKKIANGFINDTININIENAKILRDVINILSTGFEKVELKSQNFSSIFSKPMTVDEAKTAFDKFLEDQCVGKERNKIRIILSGK